MGYDERHQPNSSGTLVSVIGVGLVLAILAIIAVAGVGLVWVRTSTQQARVFVVEQQAVAELHRVGVEAQNAAAIAAALDARLHFELNLDREGNASKDGERIGLDELRAEIAKFKEVTSNVFRVRINADSDCPIKHVVPILNVLDEVGDIGYRIVASETSDVSADESTARDE